MYSIYNLSTEANICVGYQNLCSYQFVCCVREEKGRRGQIVLSLDLGLDIFYLCPPDILHHSLLCFVLQKTNMYDQLHQLTHLPSVFHLVL
jgi:hypothetical protein